MENEKGNGAAANPNEEWVRVLFDKTTGNLMISGSGSMALNIGLLKMGQDFLDNMGRAAAAQNMARMAAAQNIVVPGMRAGRG